MPHSQAGEVVEHLSRARGRAGTLAVEIVEGLLLATVALMTAWSGYQSALWDSRSASTYSLASRLRISAQGAQTRSGQEMLYDSSTFNSWLEATQAGNTTLASFFERRFRPEYKVAFDAWLITDPLHNPLAPPGPAFMPQYKNADSDLALKLEREAEDARAAGDHAREVGDQYVRVTVLLAVVLFLTALSQRFTIRGVRVGILVLALVVLGISVLTLASITG